MDTERLRAFVAIAEHGHFGRAADRLNITQPGLTKRIHALEAELGGALFDRQRQPAAVTPLGRLLLPQATRILSDFDALMDNARRAAAGEIGSLAIGFGLSTISIAPRLVARFRAVHPNVGVTMNDFSSHEQVELLRRDALDLGFVRLPVPAEFEALPLATDQLAVASPAGIEVRGGGDPVQAVADQDFVALRDERGPGLSAQIRAWCRASAFHPRIVQEADDIQTVLALVAAGLGCAIVPASSAALLPGRLTLTPIAGEAAR